MPTHTLRFDAVGGSRGETHSSHLVLLNLPLPLANGWFPSGL